MPNLSKGNFEYFVVPSQGANFDTHVKFLSVRADFCKKRANES